MPFQDQPAPGDSKRLAQSPACCLQTNHSKAQTPNCLLHLALPSQEVIFLITRGPSTRPRGSIPTARSLLSLSNLSNPRPAQPACLASSFPPAKATGRTHGHAFSSLFLPPDQPCVAWCGVRAPSSSGRGSDKLEVTNQIFNGSHPLICWSHRT